MKPSMFALFFLFAFIAPSAKAQFLIDTDGDFVINGGNYYILPYINLLGGGMTLAKTGNETCPLSVVAAVTLPITTDYGLPWTIASPLRIPFIRANTIVNFFSVQGKVPSCVSLPSKWTVVEEEDGIKSVKISEHENTLKGSFKIQQVTKYIDKILFCSTDGDSCGGIGQSIDNGHRRLVITDEYTLGFVFFKAESYQVSKKLLNNVLEA